MDAILCVQCGLNLKTGQRVDYDGLEDEAPEEEEGPSLPLRMLIFVGELLPGMFRPGILLFSIIVGIIGFGVMGLGIVIFELGAMLAGIAISAGGLVAYAQAIGMLLVGEAVFLSEALAEIDSRRWYLFFLILFAPFAVAIFFIRQAMAA